MISILPESWFPMSEMAVSLLRNTGSHSPEWWFSKSGLMAQSEPEYSYSDKPHARTTRLIFAMSSSMVNLLKQTAKQYFRNIIGKFNGQPIAFDNCHN